MTYNMCLGDHDPLSLSLLRCIIILIWMLHFSNIPICLFGLFDCGICLNSQDLIGDELLQGHQILDGIVAVVPDSPEEDDEGQLGEEPLVQPREPVHREPLIEPVLALLARAVLVVAVDY